MARAGAGSSVDPMTVAIVTGASRGLGHALAVGLAGSGWRLVIDGRDPQALAAAADRLRPHTTVVALPGDVTDPEHRDALVAAADDLGGLDLLVNNAGILGPSPQPPLAERHGAIVNVTSDAAVEPYPGWGGYGSAKAALEQASRVLAAEEPELRVWWVDPGDLRTRMHQEAFPGEDISDRPLPETVVPAFLRLLAVRPPSGRIRAADLAEAAAA